MGVASLQIPRMNREWRVMLAAARIAWKPERRAWTTPVDTDAGVRHVLAVATRTGM
jgi:hypothetical protein